MLLNKIAKGGGNSSLIYNFENEKNNLFRNFIYCFMFL